VAVVLVVPVLPVVVPNVVPVVPPVVVLVPKVVPVDPGEVVPIVVIPAVVVVVVDVVVVPVDVEPVVELDGTSRLTRMIAPVLRLARKTFELPDVVSVVRFVAVEPKATHVPSVDSEGLVLPFVDVDDWNVVDGPVVEFPLLPEDVVDDVVDVVVPEVVPDVVVPPWALLISVVVPVWRSCTKTFDPPGATASTVRLVAVESNATTWPFDEMKGSWLSPLAGAVGDPEDPGVARTI
jgi:signal-induced proliferation-associated 1 like protein 3